VVSAFRDIASVKGIQRILTSGHGPRAPASCAVLGQLYAESRRMENSILIVPGSGINGQSLGRMLEELKEHDVAEIHMSGGAWMEGQSLIQSRKPGMGMGFGEDTEWKVWRTSYEAVFEVCQIFKVEPLGQDMS